MAESKSIAVHAKAFFASATLIAISLGFSWALPFVFVKCNRVADQVDCSVEKRMLGVVPFMSITVHDLKSVNLSIEAGDHRGIGTTDSFFIELTDVADNVTKVMLSDSRDLWSGSESLVKEMNAYLADSNAKDFSSWTVSLLGFAPFLPGLIGLLFAGMAIWDFFATRMKWMVSQPETRLHD